METKGRPEKVSREKKTAITKVTVGGFKSIAKKQSIEIRPLTILAGANSSGKSSMMQSLLLLKQTLEASYDPGPLLLDGPNVKFSSLEQIFSRCGESPAGKSFSFGISVAETDTIEVTFAQGKGLEIRELTYSGKGGHGTLRQEMSSNEAVRNYPQQMRDDLDYSFPEPGIKEFEFTVGRIRCFLEARDISGQAAGFRFVPGDPAGVAVQGLIHLPGLRGNPERAYPKTAVGPMFPGTFENYAASVIANWQDQKDVETLKRLGADLEFLGLTWKVVAKPIDDTKYELYVGRLSHAARSKGEKNDLVSIADAGFGISQALPLLVALHVAAPGQMVYVEQPELHQHPRAQSALALVLANAAKRGVRVVAETHSSLLLLGIQSLVAEGKLPEDLVKLHWFTRDAKDGSTKVDSAELDKAGRFGDWPEDFGQVELEADNHYLDAVDALHLKE